MNMLFVYKYTVTGGILMNKFKHMKKILKQCIYQLDESFSLFVVNPEKDFTRKDIFNKRGYRHHYCQLD